MLFVAKLFVPLLFWLVNGYNFSRVTEVLQEASEVLPNLAFSASTEDDGRVYTYEHGKMTMDTVVMVASSSKWISAVTILRQAALGRFSLDDRVCKFFDWWSCNATKDPFGIPRANVTVREAMSFVDGTAGLTASSTCPNKASEYEECTKALYDVEKIWANVPNSTFDYNEYHLQFAGTVAEKVAGRTIDLLLNDTLTYLNMTDSFYEGGKTPDISAELHSTGNDYDKFLSSLYHKTLPDITDELLDEMESDYSVGKEYTEFGKLIQGFIGHYGLGNWLDCGFIDYNNMTLWPWCQEHNVRSCIGLFGYYPVMDRSRKFWNQVVLGPGEDPAQVPLAVMTGRVAKDELDQILAPDVERGMNSCVFLKYALEKQSFQSLYVQLNPSDVERVHSFARKLQGVLQC